MQVSTSVIFWTSEQKHSITRSGAIGTGWIGTAGGKCAFFGFPPKRLRTFDTYPKAEDIDRVCLAGSVLCSFAGDAASGCGVL